MCRLALILLVPLASAVLTYFGFVYEEWLDGVLALSAATALVMLPAAVVAAVFEVVVLLPLWTVVGEQNGRSVLAFVAFATVIWLAAATLLLRIVKITDDVLESESSIIVPGIVLVLAFCLVARSLRRDEHAPAP